MYSDEWMRQNQFLGKSARVGDILESKRRKLPELLSVDVSSTVRDAIATMNRFGVSQLPVFDKENLIGSLCESALFQRSMETPEVMEATVGGLLEPPFPTVGADEDVYEVVKLLKSCAAVLVREAGKYQGIVTRFDVVGYLGGQP
jgi:cystathionine beta-synthase